MKNRSVDESHKDKKVNRVAKLFFVASIFVSTVLVLMACRGEPYCLATNQKVIPISAGALALLILMLERFSRSPIEISVVVPERPVRLYVYMFSICLAVSAIGWSMGSTFSMFLNVLVF